MTLNVEALNEVGRIFDWRPDPARYFASAGTEEVRQALLSNLLDMADAHGVLMLAGEAGSGKTLLVATVLQSLPAHWLHIAELNFTVMSGQEIASAIAYAFGMPPGPSVMSHQSPRDWIETQLRVWASCDEASLLVVDEAQNLPPDALQTLLELNQQRLGDRPVLRVLLVGQPEFLQRLSAPNLPAEFPLHAGDLGPTLVMPLVMPALTPKDSAAYLRHRLAQYAGPTLPSLTPSAFTEIHARTRGRPGRINVLCQQLLHSAILLESYEPIDAAAVALQADELLYHADPSIKTLVDMPVDTPALPPTSAPTAASTAAPVVLAAVPAPSPIPVPSPNPIPSTSPSPSPQPQTIQREASIAAVRRTPPPKPAHMRRLAAWSTGFVAIALVAGLTWFYTPSPSSDPAVPRADALAVAAPANPAAAPITPPIEPPMPPTIATETTETPDPQTEALLSEPAEAVIRPATAVAPPLPKEPPHAPSISLPPTTAVAVPKPARPVPQTSTPSPYTRCTNLLAQMSLGEPLTAKQKLVLETNCRKSK